MKHILRSVLFTALFTILVVGVFPVAAQIKTVDNCSELGIACGSTSADAVNYIKNIIYVFLALVTVIAAVFIIYGGVQLVTSQGDSKKADAAKHTILYAVIGLIIIGLAAALVNFTVGAIHAT